MRELAAASLLCAGLLAALGRRRRQQLWRRAFGNRLPYPEGDAATVEQTLLLAAQPSRAAALDRPLRSLAVAAAEADVAPPSIYAAHVSGSGIDLLLAPADRSAPAPWKASTDGRRWSLAQSALAGLPTSGSGPLAPYPGLVCVGADDDGQVLLDLEAAPGIVALSGPEERRLEVLAAMAAELATNLWSDHLRLTLVGFGAELTVLAPDRVRAVASLGEVLAELELRAAETCAGVGRDRHRLGADGAQPRHERGCVDAALRVGCGYAGGRRTRPARRALGARSA